MLDFITLTDLLIGGAIIAVVVVAISVGRLVVDRRRRERERDR